MFIPWTMAALATLTAFMVIVRTFWLRVPSRLRWLFLRLAIAAVLVQAFFYLTKWGTTSAYLNVVIYWIAVAAYELLVMIFSCFSPKWLTSISAVILILPLFASSFLLPLTGIFRPGSLPERRIENNLYYKVFPSSNGESGPGISSFDLNVYYQPVFAPFLSRRVQKQTFNTSECNVKAAFVVRGLAPNTLIARCPHWPTQPAGSEDRVLYLKTM